MSLVRSLADRLESAEETGGRWDAALTFLPSLGLSKAVFLDLSQRNAPILRSNAGPDWDRTYAASVKSGNDPFDANCLS